MSAEEFVAQHMVHKTDDGKLPLGDGVFIINGNQQIWLMFCCTVISAKDLQCSRSWNNVTCRKCLDKFAEQIGMIKPRLVK